MNKVILIGRIASEVETRRTSSGKAVSSYRIAVDRRFKKEGQPDADFLSCVAFGNNGEFAEKYLNKGMKIAVEGSIQTRSYEGKDGKKVYVTEIIVDNHEFCEKKNDSGATPYPAAQASDFALLDDSDSALPF
jgi:single-strand DNA-binding protein